MIILLKVLKYSVFTAFAGKLIYIPHIISKYNRALKQASESYYETFISNTNGYYDLCLVFSA